MGGGGVGGEGRYVDEGGKGEGGGGGEALEGMFGSHSWL